MQTGMEGGKDTRGSDAFSFSGCLQLHFPQSLLKNGVFGIHSMKVINLLSAGPGDKVFL